MNPGTWTMIVEDYSNPEDGRMLISDREISPTGKAFYKVERHPTP